MSGRRIIAHHHHRFSVVVVVGRGIFGHTVYRSVLQEDEYDGNWVDAWRTKSRWTRSRARAEAAGHCMLDRHRPKSPPTTHPLPPRRPE